VNKCKVLREGGPSPGSDRKQGDRFWATMQKEAKGIAADPEGSTRGWEEQRKLPSLP